MRERRRFLLRTGLLAGAVLVICFFILGIFPQHGNGMYPAAKDGDLVLTCLLQRQYHPEAMAAYRTPDGKRKLGRIVAMGGDRVDITEEGRVMVNDILLTEQVFFETAREGSRIGDLPLTVPDGGYYILNDNRTDPADSRSYGVIGSEQMRGEAFWLFRRRGF